MTSDARSVSNPRKPLSEVVYEKIRGEILHGELAKNSPLNQVELAERYGVSRIPIREALWRLQAESLVVATPHHKFVVREISREQVLELLDIRQTLEDLAISKRGPFTVRELVELRTINSELAASEDPAAISLLERRFHQVLLGPDNIETVELISEIRDRARRYLNTLGVRRPGAEDTAQQHTSIITAVESGDTDLVMQRLREHVSHRREFLLAQLSADEVEEAEAG